MRQVTRLVERGEPSIADGPHSACYLFPAITALSLLPSVPPLFPTRARGPMCFSVGNRLNVGRGAWAFDRPLRGLSWFHLVFRVYKPLGPTYLLSHRFTAS